MSGGSLPCGPSGADTVRLLLSPGGPITDPDQADALGLTVEARRLREAATTPTDPRIGQLMDLAQGLLAGYAELATTIAAHIPDPHTRSRLLADAEKTVAVARGRYCDIVERKTA